jgi:isopenicillin-N epimerase
VIDAANTTGHRLGGHWGLRLDVLHLNHGSFGACPREVLAAQHALREEMEKAPTDFLWRSFPRRLEEARRALAHFVAGREEDLVFVPNATAGVNAVARSLELAAGDEVLVTDHAYGACRKAFEYVARRAGAKVVTAHVPFPLRSADDVFQAVMAAVTPRTRLALLDHVTSPTALVFPIVDLVQALRARGVETLVDGAHAPGQVTVELDVLGAGYYTGNAHKWMCAPKGAAFLHVRHDLQSGVHPLSISHGYDPGSEGARFRDEFDWTGTDDPTPVLALPAAIRFMNGLLPGGWDAIRARNHALAVEAREIVAEALGVPLPCPGDLCGSMASLPLPRPKPGAPAEGLNAEGLMHWVRDRGIQSWFYDWPAADGGLLVRVSAQLYNDRAQFRALAALLREAFVG